MRRHRTNLRTSLRTTSRRDHERGIVVMLVAIVMLGVVGAMAALSIDVVTIYTARSEAQLAADGAALAAARVLANSGMTSDPNAATDNLEANAWTLASAVALRVAERNRVGGANLVASEVTLPAFPGGTYTNPTVTVTVLKTNLPTFFGRIWGTQFLTVRASATAEAYNPSGVVTAGKSQVAPTCVKPWLLPNIDPSNLGNPIFNTTTGAIAPTATALLGWTSGAPMTLNSTACNASGTCLLPLLPSSGAMPVWNYFPGDDASFPHPTKSLPSTCTPALTANYQESIAGCIQTPISCNSLANIDTSTYPNASRNSDTADAVNCLTHATANPLDADQVDVVPPSPPFRFFAGANNPIGIAAGEDVMVSSSLVTVPVFDSSPSGAGSWRTTGSVQIVGFVQLFLNPDGNPTPASGLVNTTVINMAGCGTNATGTTILGNGASPVAVRLIAP